MSRMEQLKYANAYGVRSKYLTTKSKQEIVKKRNEFDLSRSDLNILCGFIPNTIYKIETGTIIPTIYQIKRLNTILCLNLRYC